MNKWIKKRKPEDYYVFFGGNTSQIQGSFEFDSLFDGAHHVSCNVHFGGDHGVKYPRYASFQIYTPSGGEWDLVQRVLKVMPEESSMSLKTAQIGTKLERVRFTMSRVGAWSYDMTGLPDELGPLTIEITPAWACYRGTTSARDIVGISCAFEQMKVI